MADVRQVQCELLLDRVSSSGSDIRIELEILSRSRVPHARTQIRREVKVDEILDAAERRLTRGGYNQMSVAAIARELGVASNSIYWYFPSKDDLFIGALRRVIAGLAARKPPSSRGLVAQVLWATDQMHGLAALRSDLRERAKQSRIAGEFNQELDDLIRRLLIHGIEPYLGGADAGLAVTTFLATVEGTFMLGLKKPERHK